MYQRCYSYGISSKMCQNYLDFWPKINILVMKFWYFVNRHSDRSLKMPKTVFQSQFSMSKTKWIFMQCLINSIFEPLYCLKSCPILVSLAFCLFTKYILHTIIYLECNDFNPLYFSGDFINATLWQYHDISYHSNS